MPNANRNEVPERVFPISKHIKDQLVSRGWTQRDLAFVIGRSAVEITNLMMGRKRLSPELAQGLEVALGGGAEHWLALDSAYQLSRTDYVDEAVVLRSRLFSYPIKEMQKRGWIAGRRDVRELESELKLFLDRDLDAPASG